MLRLVIRGQSFQHSYPQVSGTTQIPYYLSSLSRDQGELILN